MGDSIERFSVNIDEAVLRDLRRRIIETRWPAAAPGVSWDYGTDLGYLRQLCRYWADGFDWRARERALNDFNHFRTELDGVLIHFVHERAAGGSGIPLILTHGWPSSFLEMLPLVPLLTDPAAHGIDGPSFDVVIPSLPGYGFSERPSRDRVTFRDTAGLWHQLMRRLGYERYGAHGTDNGSAVTTHMALHDPGSMIGIHLSNIQHPPEPGPDARPLSDAERAYLEDAYRWVAAESGYSELQRTKPQTLSYGLNDSPAGLAAWILEKWRSWGDTQGDLNARYSRDFLLTLVTIYWVTQTITTSMRDYVYEQSDDVRIRADDFVNVPTGVALFTNEFVPTGCPPREWAERLYNIQQWTPMSSGGHFAAAEEPEALARDIAGFFQFLGDSRSEGAG
jgi:pimeloyl-ACP methyl ester carboxylesterase